MVFFGEPHQLSVLSINRKFSTSVKHNTIRSLILLREQLFNNTAVFEDASQFSRYVSYLPCQLFDWSALYQPFIYICPPVTTLPVLVSISQPLRLSLHNIYPFYIYHVNSQ